MPDAYERVTRQSRRACGLAWIDDLTGEYRFRLPLCGGSAGEILIGGIAFHESNDSRDRTRHCTSRISVSIFLVVLSTHAAKVVTYLYGALECLKYLMTKKPLPPKN